MSKHCKKIIFITEKRLKYSLLHETATNELWWTTVNSLMLLIAPRHSSTETYLTFLPELHPKKRHLPFNRELLQWPNQENTCSLNQHALPKSSPLHYHQFQAGLQGWHWNVKQAYLCDPTTKYSGYLALYFLLKSISKETISNRTNHVL